MSLSSREYNKLIDKINTTFYNLGFANGMQMPPCDKNTCTRSMEDVGCISSVH